MLPQTQHPYVYVGNNPVVYTDPRGEIAPILVAAGIGAAIGGIGGGVSYVLAHPGGRPEDYLRSGAFWRSVGVGAASGAVAGAVGWAVPALLPAGGFWGSVGVGALSGSLASGAGQVTANLLTPCTPWHSGLAWAMVTGGVTGGVAGGVGYGIGRLARPAVAGTAVSRPVQPYEVGIVDDLLNRSVPGDRLQVHHVPQAHPAGQVIAGYDPSTAPGIVLPDYEHQAIPNLTGTYSGTARDLVARDLWNLRMHTGAPNSALQQLLNLIHQIYGF